MQMYTPEGSIETLTGPVTEFRLCQPVLETLVISERKRIIAAIQVKRGLLPQPYL